MRQTIFLIYLKNVNYELVNYKTVSVMKTSKQIEIDFWKKKTKTYIRLNDNTQINDCSLIPARKIPTDITVSKKLSNKITISISNNHNNENRFFCCSFYYEKTQIFGHFSNYADTVRLFNTIYENFEKDNSEIRKILKPIKVKEQEYLAIVTAIKTYVTNMMNDTEYKWKLDEQETVTILKVQLNSPRIIEIEIFHKTFINHPELFEKNKILNSIKKIDEAFEENILPVNIVNNISGRKI